MMIVFSRFYLIFHSNIIQPNYAILNRFICVYFIKKKQCILLNVKLLLYSFNIEIVKFAFLSVLALIIYLFPISKLYQNHLQLYVLLFV